MAKYDLREAIEAIKCEKPFKAVLEWCQKHGEPDLGEEGVSKFSYMRGNGRSIVGIVSDNRILAEMGEYIYVDKTINGGLTYMEGHQFESIYIKAEEK